MKGALRTTKCKIVRFAPLYDLKSHLLLATWGHNSYAVCTLSVTVSNTVRTPVLAVCKNVNAPR